MNRVPGLGDPYKKIFDTKTVKTISGRIIRIDQVPEYGFGLQMRLTLYVDKKEIVPIYLGPVFYLLEPSASKTFQIGR